MKRHQNQSSRLGASPIATVEFSEVVRLQQHVVELQEGQGLLTFQTQPHAIVGHHAVDGEVRAILSKKVEVRQLAQPFVVVHKLRICRAVPEGQELGENARESINVPLYTGSVSIVNRKSRMNEP